MAGFKPYVILSIVSLLGGCLHVSEDVSRSAAADWHKLTTTNWLTPLGELTGLTEAFPSAARREAKADAALCNHPRGSNRVVMENGVEGRATYRRCAVSPYAAAGMRLDGR